MCVVALGATKMDVARLAAKDRIQVAAVLDVAVTAVGDFALSMLHTIAAVARASGGAAHPTPFLQTSCLEMAAPRTQRAWKLCHL